MPEALNRFALVSSCSTRAKHQTAKPKAFYIAVAKGFRAHEGRVLVRPVGKHVDPAALEEHLNGGRLP